MKIIFAFINLIFIHSLVCANIYQLNVTDIDGVEVNLSKYQGKTLLIVNTASQCGFTPQYASLEKLYQKYKETGFEILAFPANNFLNQEPGTNADIKTFCQNQYQVSFPLFSKISVIGEEIHPLYRYLTQESPFPGKITWNFNKFLINAQGEVVARFGTRIDPLDPSIQTAIQISRVS